MVYPRSGLIPRNKVWELTGEVFDEFYCLFLSNFGLQVTSVVVTDE